MFQPMRARGYLCRIDLVFVCCFKFPSGQPAYTVTVNPQTAQVVLMPKRLEAMAIEHISHGV
jgi:hypothetical protein